MTLEKYYERTRVAHTRSLQRRHKVNREDAEDVVQDAFVRACKSWHNYDSKKGSVGAWFFTILLRSLSAFRKKDREYDLEKEIAALCAEPEHIEMWDMPDPPNVKHKEVLRRMLLGGESYTDIAYDLDLQHDTVRKIVYRFKKGLVYNDVE